MSYREAEEKSDTEKKEGMDTGGVLCSRPLGVPMIQEIITLLVLSAAVATISTTAVLSHMPLLMGIRRFFYKHSPNYIGGLLMCPYCVSHWVAVGLAILFQPSIINCGIPVVNWITTAFAMVAISSVLIFMIVRTAMRLEGSFEEEEGEE